MSQQRETAFRRGGKSTGLTARGHAAHKHAIVLRIDHGGAIAEQGAFADYTRVVR